MRAIAILSVLLLAAPALAAPPASLLVNGGLESWDASNTTPTSWSTFRVSRSNDASEGESAARLHAKSSGPGNGIASFLRAGWTATSAPPGQVPLVPGTMYEIAFDAKGVLTGSTRAELILSYQFAGTPGRSYTLPLAPVGPEYETQGAQFIAPIGVPTATSIMFYAWAEDGGQIELFIDNVRVGPASP